MLSFRVKKKKKNKNEIITFVEWVPIVQSFAWIHIHFDEFITNRNTSESIDFVSCYSKIMEIINDGLFFIMFTRYDHLQIFIVT